MMPTSYGAHVDMIHCLSCPYLRAGKTNKREGLFAFERACFHNQILDP